MTHRIEKEPIPVFFKKVLSEKLNGELIITGNNFQKRLYFMEGNLKFAKTNIIQERLGEILFKLGKINQAQFWNIHKLIEHEDEKIGSVLIKNKILAQKDIFFGLLHQIRTIATSVFSLLSGEWDFVSKIPEFPDDLNFTIELPRIIIEGVEKLANTSYYKEIFLHQNIQTSPLPETYQEFISNPDKDFFNKLSDLNNIPAKQVMIELKMPEEIFWKKLLLFYFLNALSFIKTDKKDKNLEYDKNTQELLQFYDKIKSKSLNYYEIFNIKNTANFPEIKEAYFNYAKKFHPDRLSNVSDREIKEKANFVFATINKAYDILTNEDKKREYDNAGFKEDDGEEKIQENIAEKASILYRKAKTLYNQKKYWEAATLLEEAIRYSPNKPAYFLMLGLSQSNIPSFKRMAEQNLQKVIELEPWNAEPYLAMGLLFLTENLPKRAERFLKKALSINPEHALAKKKVQELYGIPAKKRSFGSIFGKKKK